MSKGSFFVILILSVITTYGTAIIDEMINLAKNPTGFPFGFANFNFLGGSNNNLMFLIDVAFWFIVIFVAWKLLPKIFKK